LHYLLGNIVTFFLFSVIVYCFVAVAWTAGLLFPQLAPVFYLMSFSMIVGTIAFDFWDLIKRRMVTAD
jgi:hypothetical protein